jgi:hypothetical protein
MLENEPGIYQRTSSPVRKPVMSRHSSLLTLVQLADTPVHFQFEPLPAALDHQRLPGPSYDVESAVPLQVLLTQVHPNAPGIYQRTSSPVRKSITSRHSSLLTQVHLEYRYSRTLPVRITASCFWPATSTWSAIRRGKRSAASRAGKRSTPRRCVSISTLAAWACAVSGRCPGTVAWHCAINRRPGSSA